MTSVSGQAEPRPPVSFVDAAYELVELCAGPSDVTTSHSPPFRLTGERFIAILARLKRKPLRPPKVGSVPRLAVFHGIGGVIHLDSIWK